MSSSELQKFRAKQYHSTISSKVTQND